jgi:hypothetical protein
VYSGELHQHAPNPEQRLRDPMDAFNTYIVIKCGDALLGCVSITPPDGGRYSIDKYWAREQLPFAIHGRLYEVRLGSPCKCRT